MPGDRAPRKEDVVEPNKTMKKHMPDDTNDTDESEQSAQNVSADSAEGSSLDVAWKSRAQYRVFSSHEDSDSHFYEVDLDDGSCTCKHGQMHEDSTKSCKHVQAAVRAHHSEPDLEHAINLETAAILAENRNALERVETGGTTTQTQESNNGDSDASESEEEEDGSPITYYKQDDLDLPQEGLKESLQEWFETVAGFNDFDPSIVDLNYGEAEGREGIIVETEPFSSGYYDNDAGEWANQEGFNEQKDKVKNLLKSRDEFEYYGDPEYVNFIPQDEATEVVE